MLKRASIINEEIDVMLQEDKIRMEVEHNENLKKRIDELADLIDEAKANRQKYVAVYKQILDEYPDMKRYLNSLGYIIVYNRMETQYYIAFNETIAKRLLNQTRKKLCKKILKESLVIIALATMWYSVLLSNDMVIKVYGGGILLGITFTILYVKLCNVKVTYK